MNKRIKDYVDGLFNDIPNSKKARDLKTEIASNLDERYEDYIRDGKSPSESFHLTVSSLGSIDQFLEDVMPDDNFMTERNKYLKRNALIIGFSVGGYIMSGAVLIGAGIISEYLDFELMAELGLVGTIMIVAISTIAIIYGNLSTPDEFKQKCPKEEETSKKTDIVSSIYWMITTLIFFVLMFVFRIWNAWVIWIFAGIIWSIISTIIKLRETNEK